MFLVDTGKLSTVKDLGWDNFVTKSADMMFAITIFDLALLSALLSCFCPCMSHNALAIRAERESSKCMRSTKL